MVQDRTSSTVTSQVQNTGLFCNSRAVLLCNSKFRFSMHVLSSCVETKNYWFYFSEYIDRRSKDLRYNYWHAHLIISPDNELGPINNFRTSSFIVSMLWLVDWMSWLNTSAQTPIFNGYLWVWLAVEYLVNALHPISTIWIKIKKINKFESILVL